MFYFCLTILLSILNTNQCIYQSITTLSNNGFQFQPVNYEGQILSTFINEKNLLQSCSMLCNNNILCRIFDINGNVSNQCRIFQGDINIHGNIIPSTIANAQVGVIEYSNDLFANYGQSCSSNSSENRYLICGTNFTWKCPQNTYWNQTISMCLAQSPLLGSVCQQNVSMCREDLNYTCLRFNQCGPLSLYMGTTIADNSTIIENSTTIGLRSPQNILVNKTRDNSIIVINTNNKQVISFYDNGLTINNVSLIAQNWSGGNSFLYPIDACVDPKTRSDLYVVDIVLNCVIKFFNMQVISPLPIVVAGVKGISGNGTDTLNKPVSLTIDRNGNLFIADYYNHRIMFWPSNSTNGTMIAGLGTGGNDSFSLNYPRKMFLDENNSFIYIADTYNHRIQRFSLFGGSPNNGTTVAGGNGLGSTNKQLNAPYDVYVSKKTKAIYIADTYNHRIQRWSQGEQSGVTIAGDPNGNSGRNATMFYGPSGIAFNDDETFLYVVDSGNNRIQRFQIV